MSRSRMVWRSLVPCLALALVAGAGCAKKSGDAGGGAGGEIKIGVYGSTSGNDADFGLSTERGVKLALEELKASSGGAIGGLTITPIYEDDRSLPEEAATVVQKLVNQDQVSAVIGE